MDHTVSDRMSHVFDEQAQSSGRSLTYYFPLKSLKQEVK